MIGGIRRGPEADRASHGVLGEEAALLLPYPTLLSALSAFLLMHF